MPALNVARETNAAFAPTYTPVMVITGATSGIGQAITELFAQTTQGKAHIILVARNQAAADEIIASLPKPSSASQDHQYTYEFIRCDVTSMKSIHEMSKNLVQRLPKINFLVHCAGGIDFAGRVNTEEGLDTKLAFRYYSKFALSYDLLPLLRNAVKLKEKAAVVSVLGAGYAPDIDTNNLGMEQSYTGLKAISQSLAYVDVMTAEFARREPDIAWIHTYPGSVYTRGMLTIGGPAVQFGLSVLSPILKLTLIKKEDCAERILFILLSAGKGLGRYNEKGDDIGMKKFPATEAGEALFNHSVKATLCEEH
ncbi:hypothetical protein CPB83DRAFT_820023 [Crepidotus variabilis]|uniref:NAD(P)-binding protein n=1 Tax=Crepidotus variabilis TaxID=179855 RepID=A0A9P6JL87_9AGAR|nr:hypothetical protein CPB83DRAFT_820023 [Crepidotus variabilis]